MLHLKVKLFQFFRGKISTFGQDFILTENSPGLFSIPLVQRIVLLIPSGNCGVLSPVFPLEDLILILIQFIHSLFVMVLTVVSKSLLGNSPVSVLPNPCEVAFLPCMFLSLFKQVGESPYVSQSYKIFLSKKIYTG